MGIITFLILENVQAQESFVKFPSSLKGQTILTEGTYFVEGISVIEKNANLTLSDNVALLFAPNAAIRVMGGLKIQGSSNNLINIRSANRNDPGIGFVFSGWDQSAVDIKYARFNYLKKPFSFEFRWSRTGVNISHNVFKNSNFDGAALEVKEIDNLLTDKPIVFKFRRNTISNNKSGALISNISTDLLTMLIDSNVFTRNEYIGRVRNGIFTSPLYFTYNYYENAQKPQFIQNAIFDNFSSLYFNDSFNIDRINVSVVGNATELDLSNNYFGNPAKREIEDAFDFVSSNYKSPFLSVKNKLDAPSPYINGHFYEVMVNKKPLNEKYLFEVVEEEIKEIVLVFNRPIVLGKNYSVHYTYAQNDSIKIAGIKNNITWENGNRKAIITIKESIRNYSNEGYLTIDGLYDANGFDVPSLEIGKRTLTNTNLNQFIPIDVVPKVRESLVNLDTVAEVQNPNQDTIDILKQLNDTFIERIEKYWELGFFAGNAMYFGDMNATTITIDPRNMRPNFGLRVGYQLTPRWKLNFYNNNLIIYASDLPKPNRSASFTRSTGFERNFSVRTTIIDASLITGFNLSKFRTKKSIVTSVYGGGSVYYFKPMAQVNGQGEWHDLRSLGTGGQTINGGSPYKKVMFGIPMGVEIKRHLTQNLILGLSYTYNKIFTDYLDDISTDPYPNVTDLRNANPSNPDIAVKLSNPENQSGLRTYSNKHDSYSYWGLTFTWKLKR